MTASDVGMRDKHGNIVVENSTVFVQLTVRSGVVCGKVKRIIGHTVAEKDIAVIYCEQENKFVFARSRQVEVVTSIHILKEP